MADPFTSQAASQDARERTERTLDHLFEDVFRAYLTRLRAEISTRLDAPGPALTAAPTPRPPGSPFEDLESLNLLEYYRIWYNTVGKVELYSGVLGAWWRFYRRRQPDVRWRDRTPTSALRTAVKEYLPRVHDRLVRGIDPPVTDDSFDMIRVILAQATGAGWSRDQVAQRIALALSWEPNRSGWKRQLSRVDAQIDVILDRLGDPGDPLREAAKHSDPRMARLYDERNKLISRMEARESYWQTRAHRIARTEATALHGWAADSALAAEGYTHKQWVATNDSRTRDSHASADGQEVPINTPFTVGGFLLEYPGDPNAPAAETINCRCTLIGAGTQTPITTAPTAKDPGSEWGDLLNAVELGELDEDQRRLIYNSINPAFATLQLP